MKILFLLLQWVIFVVAESQARLECIDSQLNGSLEYVPILRYKSVGYDKNNPYTCSMITQCSVDRLDRLTKQLKAWGGATSAAVYVPTKSPIQQLKDLSTIDKYIANLQADSEYKGWLTLSVLFGNEEHPDLWNCTKPKSPGMPLYPINALRNLAAAAAIDDSRPKVHRSPQYLFYLDADFVPSAGLSGWIDTQAKSRGKGTLHQLIQNDNVLVLPAFESSAAAPRTPTRSLNYLLDGIKDNTIKQFHGVRFAAGHGSSDYERWEKLSRALKSQKTHHHPFKPYEAVYKQGYEPYFIVARKSFVPYDERFRGYGLNKCVNVRWLAENGTAFYVLPGHFVVEDKHIGARNYQKFADNYSNVMAAYKAALADMQHKRMPLISDVTAQLFRDAGLERVATEDPATHKEYLQSIANVTKPLRAR